MTRQDNSVPVVSNRPDPGINQTGDGKVSKNNIQMPGWAFKTGIYAEGRNSIRNSKCNSEEK